jgi:hypothetical protein
VDWTRCIRNDFARLRKRVDDTVVEEPWPDVRDRRRRTDRRRGHRVRDSRVAGGED